MQCQFLAKTRLKFAVIFIFLFEGIELSFAESFCNSIPINTSISEIAKWSNSIYQEQDEKRMENLLKDYNFEEKSELIDNFYNLMSEPFQSKSCNIVKRFAGTWKYGFLDGEKLVCMDGIYKAVKNGNCLIYSFGLAEDWDFEILLANLGKFL